MLTNSPIAMVALLLIAAASAGAGDLGQSGFVDSGGVKLHFVAAGEGPLLDLLHGFPDYHYTWRDQMPALSTSGSWPEHFGDGATAGRGARVRVRVSLDEFDRVGLHEYQRVHLKVGGQAERMVYFRQKRAAPPCCWLEFGDLLGW